MSTDNHVLNVLITVDAETYPLCTNWRFDGLVNDMHRDLYGETAEGPFGIRYQIDVLNEHRLKAVFFLESLFATAMGVAPLRTLVREIQDRGHEVQLHLHPEWLQWMEQPPVHGAGRGTIMQFSLREQTDLIRVALSNLIRAGATRICAFRAGDYAANSLTLAALRSSNICYDSSYNPCFADSLADVADVAGRNQPCLLDGIWEIPIASWTNAIGLRRHAQLCAASFGELTEALWSAWRQRHHSFVIVSHSFELLKKRRQRILDPRPDRLVVRRFHALCRFLRDNHERFRTCGFSQLDRSRFPPMSSTTALRVPLRHTAWRICEQAYRRLM